MASAEMEGARAAVLVAGGCVVGARLHAVGRVAGPQQVPEILRGLGEARSHQPAEAGDEDTGGQPSHGATIPGD